MKFEDRKDNDNSAKEEKKDVFTDWFLQNLVGIINGSDAQLAITLNVGGILISGLLISGHKYFESFAEAFYSGVVDSDKLKNYFLSLGKVYTSEKEGITKPPVYIHLREAQYYQPGSNHPLPSNEGILWRGKISSVDGFLLGKLSINQGQLRK